MSAEERAGKACTLSAKLLQKLDAVAAIALGALGLHLVGAVSDGLEKRVGTDCSLPVFPTP